MRLGLLGKIFLPTFLWSFGLMAQTGQRPTVEERLIRLEEKVDAIEKRLEDTNKRIDDLRNDIKNQFENIRVEQNNRFSEINNRFDDLRFWLGLIATIVLAALGGLFGMGLYIIKNLHRVENGVAGKALPQAHFNELEEMRKRIAALEAQLKQPQVGPA
jgi:cell division protein FtsB